VQIGDPWLNLRLDKSWRWGQLVPGGRIRYSVDYQNDGNLPVAGTIRVTDTLPVSTTLEDWWSDYGPTVSLIPQGNSSVVWQINGLKAGYSGNIVVELAVAGSASPGTILTNTAQISCVSGEGDCSDNEDVWVEELYAAGAPNLRVRKYGDWHNWGDWGLEAWYQVAIENVGDQKAGPVVFTDTYDSKMYMNWINVQYDDRGGERSWSWGEDPGGHYFTVTLEALEALDPGETAWVNFNTMTDTWPVPAALFANTAEVQCLPGEVDWPGCGNNTDQRILATGPDLFVEKELIGGELLPGELVTFSLVFGNAACSGPRETQGDVVVSDTLSANLVYSSAVESCGSDWCPREPISKGQELGWWYGNFGNCEEYEIRLTVRISDTVADGDPITNAVQITTTQPVSDTELDYGNNSDEYTATLLLPVFTVTKTYEGEVAGSIVTYTLTVTNSGSVSGTGVVLSETLPTEVEFKGSDGIEAGGVVTWTFARIDPGLTATGHFSAELLCQAGRLITNDLYLVIASDQHVVSGLGRSVVLKTVTPTIQVDVTHTLGVLVISDTILFTATVDTDGTAIEDYVWNFGQGEVSGDVTATHRYTEAGSYTVYVTVTDGCAYTGTGSVEFEVVAPELHVAKEYASSRVAGTIVTYTLTVTNTGQAAASGVVLSERLPQDLTFGGSDGSYNIGSGDITWAFSTIPAGNGTVQGWFSATLPCTADLEIVNDRYLVVTSTRGVTTPLGAAVSLTTVSPTISLSLSYLPLDAVAGDLINFTAQVQSDGTEMASYAWDFGDGVGSVPGGLAASHTYGQDGSYEVVFTATDGCGYYAVAAKTVDVREPVLNARFDQSAQEVLVGETVYFTDTSTTGIQAGQAAPISQWQWDFGDGSAPATTQNAQHAYAQEGTFTVTLTITDAVGYSDDATGSVKVVLGCTPLVSAALDYAPPEPAINATVVFTATFQPVTATLPITYEWAFGDGQTATSGLPTVQHIYTTSGPKTAQVTIKNACTPAGVTAPQTINVTGLRVYLPLILRKR